MKRKLSGLLAALMLFQCAGISALAAGTSFKDLPASHWAYKEITRAVSYGIMGGLGDGRMNPDGTLTWAHYLSMISRTFAPMAYEGARSSGADWRTAGYQVALNKGWLLSADFLTVTQSALNEPISRQDVAVLLSRTIPDAPYQSAGSAANYDSGTPSGNGYNSGTSSGSGYNSGTSSGSGSNSGTSSGSGTSSVTVPDGSGMRIETGENGEVWLVMGGVKIPIKTSNAAYYVIDGETTESVTTKPASNPSNDSNNYVLDGETTDGGSGSWESAPSVVTPAPSTVTPAPSTPAPAPVIPSTPAASNPPLTDFAQMDSAHQAAVRRLYELGIVKGKSDGSFGPIDTVRRSDGAVLLMRTIDAVDALRNGEPVSLTLELVDANGKALGEPFEGNGRIRQSLYSLAAVYAPLNYKAIAQDGNVTVARNRYALRFAPLTQAEIEEREAEAQYRSGQISYEEYMQKDFWLKKLGSNERKRALIYGAEYTETIETEEGPQTVTRTEISYGSAEEAASHMVWVEVPVWRLRGQTKTPGTMNIQINAALAEELKAIFTEIYNDAEQFPFDESAGGYSWRENNSKSEHIRGTAVDLNVDANFQVREGAALVGTHWTPGEDPYSITPGGSVVRIFAEHGWDWGGNAWAGHSDPTYGYHDYMHFSYFGA